MTMVAGQNTKNIKNKRTGFSLLNPANELKVAIEIKKVTRKPTIALPLIILIKDNNNKRKINIYR